MVSHHTALIYTMVLVSAADGDMTDAELAVIGDIIRTLPVFADYDVDKLTQASTDCAELLGVDDGVDQHAGGVEMQAPGPRIKNAVGGFDL